VLPQSIVIPSESGFLGLRGNTELHIVETGK
jgi:hypothetical protein